MNLMVYRHGKDCLIVDAGMMFPREEHPGIDVILPDLGFLSDCGRLQALILTHGHEDHVGAAPFLLARHDLPVYGSPYTLGVLRARLQQHGLADRVRLRPLPPDGTLTSLGPFELETVHVTHSIPQCKMVVLRTSLGTIVHTADFKLDPDPPGEKPTALERLRRIGDDGVLALFSDSTNADRPGRSGGERSVGREIDKLVAAHPGRVLVTTFASNVQRMQQLARIVGPRSRKLAIVGSSMLAHAELAQRLGLLRFPTGVRISADHAMELPPSEVLVLATGSQGEPLSALARISRGEHREVRLSPGDRVIHSARVIPGNERHIAKMMDRLLRGGAELVAAENAPVHVSGHPAREELRDVLQAVRPRHLVPIHGEYRQLHAHAALGAECGMDSSDVLLAESGDLIAIGQSGIRVADRVAAGQVFIDALLNEVDASTLQERRRLAGDGVLVVGVALRRRGTAQAPPQFDWRGLHSAPAAELIEEARRRVLETIHEASADERADPDTLRRRVQTELGRLLRRRTGRRPVIVPLILEP